MFVRLPILASMLLGLSACAQPPVPPSVPAATPPKPTLEFVSEWGARGDAPGQLQRPVAATSDTVGNVYIADAGNKFIQKFDANGRPLLSFQDDLLRTPSSLAVDSSGAIYVADAARNWVFVFRSNGERYRILRGTPGGRFRSAPIVAVDLLDNLYVLESGHGRIAKFGPYLSFEKEWDVPAEAGQPAQVISIAAARDGRILVAAPGKSLHVFSSEGELAAPSGVGLENGHRSGGLAQIAAHKDHVVGLVQGGRTVQVWTREGKEVLNESLDKHFPASDGSLAMTATSRGELFIVDAAGARVLRFRMNF
jgi:DNA-binding beta-propeller fold protein YncE